WSPSACASSPTAIWQSSLLPTMARSFIRQAMPACGNSPFDRTGRLLERIDVSDLRGELDLSRDGHFLLTDYTGPDGQESVEVIDLKRAAPIARALKRAESP